MARADIAQLARLTQVTAVSAVGARNAVEPAPIEGISAAVRSSRAGTAFGRAGKRVRGVDTRSRLAAGGRAASAGVGGTVGAVGLARSDRQRAGCAAVSSSVAGSAYAARLAAGSTGGAFGAAGADAAVAGESSAAGTEAGAATAAHRARRDADAGVAAGARAAGPKPGAAAKEKRLVSKKKTGEIKMARKKVSQHA